MEKLFPVLFNGKSYKKRDCDEVFLDYDVCIEALNGEGGVYRGV